MKSLNNEKAAFLRTLSGRIVPESASLDAAGVARFVAIVDRALMERPAPVRRQFATFLGVLRWAPLLRYGVPFDRLSEERQDVVLRWFEDNRMALLRSGLWGLKAMVYMGYYGQPETAAEVGYAPEFDGRTGLHA